MRISNKRQAQLRTAVACAIAAVVSYVVFSSALIAIPAFYGMWMLISKYERYINAWCNAPIARTHYAPRKQLLLRNVK